MAESLSLKSFVKLCSVNIFLGCGMGAGVLVALMGADLGTKSLGVFLAAIATVMCAGVTKYWPFPLKEVNQ